MKKINFICLFFSLLFVASCKKQPPTISKPDSKFSFKANDIAYNFDGAYNYSTLSGSSIIDENNSFYGFSFQGSKYPDYLSSFNFTTAESLEVKTYTAHFTARLNEINYVDTCGEADPCDTYNGLITITKIKDGLVSGNFSGKLYVWNTTTNPVIISEGVFKDLQIVF